MKKISFSYIIEFARHERIVFRQRRQLWLNQIYYAAAYVNMTKRADVAKKTNLL